MNKSNVAMISRNRHPLRIALLFGGPGRERAVSFASAKRVLSALRDQGHEVAAIDLSAGRVTFSDEVRVLGGVEVSELIPEELRSEGREFRVIADLELSDFDIVFLALHGHPGEDGTVHAVLDLKGFKCTGSCFRHVRGHLTSIRPSNDFACLVSTRLTGS